VNKIEPYIKRDKKTIRW